MASRRVPGRAEVAAGFRTQLMDKHSLDACREWFDRYCRSFLNSDPEDRRNIELKIFHTDRVFDNALKVASGEGLDHGTLLLAQAAGLLHDVGRFPQYARYKTFRDSVSANHGKLGAEVIGENRLLSDIPAEEQEAVINAVLFHNAFRIPALQDPVAVTILKVVRDSDKLDIWKVFCDLDDYAGDDWPSAAALDLPELPDYSEEAVRCLEEQRLVTLTNLKTLNDFRLMQLSWIYDLNFPASFLLLHERGFIDRYSAHLPGSGAIRDGIGMVKDFVKAKIARASKDAPDPGKER